MPKELKRFKAASGASSRNPAVESTFYTVQLTGRPTLPETVTVTVTVSELPAERRVRPSARMDGAGGGT